MDLGLLSLNKVSNLYCWEDEYYLYYEVTRTDSIPIGYEVQITKDCETWRYRPIYSGGFISEWSSWDATSSLKEMAKEQNGNFITEKKYENITDDIKTFYAISSDIAADIANLAKLGGGEFSLTYTINRNEG